MTFEQLQTTIQDTIKADAWFTDLPVLIEARGNLEAELDRTIGEMGLCLVITTPWSSMAKEHRARAVLQTEVLITAAESPLTNQTGKTSAEAIDRLIPLLHGKAVEFSSLRCSGHQAEDIPGMAVFSVKFSVTISHQPSLAS